MRIAFFGLGIMGRPMATRLVAAGHEVSVWNRSASKHIEGARTAVSPADAARDADVVWMCVADTAAVERVLFADDGAEQSLREGMIVVDSSTISPSATLRFAERVNARGVHWVDAPVTGSKIGAESGQLIFIVGGSPEAVEALQPLFKAMGKQVIHIGETGKGQAAKISMNLMIALIYEGFAEAFVLSIQAGSRSPQTDRAHSGIDGAIGSGGLQGPIRAAPRLLAQFSTAPDAQRHPPHAGYGKGAAREVAGIGDGGRDLRIIK